MLEFSLTSLDLTGGVSLTALVGGHTLAMRASSAKFSANVVLYATALSGDVQGNPVTFTAATPPSSVPANLQLTTLVAHQVAVDAGSAQISSLEVTTS